MSSKNPTEKEVENTVSTVVENDIREEDFNGGRIIHHGYSQDSIVQNIVNYAWKLGGWDFVAVLECENGRYDLKATADSGKSSGLCMMHKGYHNDIPEDYNTNRVVAVEYCYQKRKGGTRFYGPGRIIKGQRCSDYVKDRFTYIE